MNATTYPLSSMAEIETNFFFSLGTYNTSHILRGFSDFNWNEVVSTPLTAYLELFPSYTYNREFFSIRLVSDLCDLVIWQEAPLYISQVSMWLTRNKNKNNNNTPIVL